MSDAHAVRIATASCVSTALLPRILELCAVALPEISLEVVETSAAELAGLFSEAAIDVGITWAEDSCFGLEVEPFVNCRIVAAAHPKHALADGACHSAAESRCPTACRLIFSSAAIISRLIPPK